MNVKLQRKLCTRGPAESNNYQKRNPRRKLFFFLRCVGSIEGNAAADYAKALPRRGKFYYFELPVKAVLLNSPREPLQTREVSKPEARADQVLLQVRACGVCRTDLHIVDGDLPAQKKPLIPGHQIVGIVEDGATADLPRGTRVGVSWIGGVDGSCAYCQRGQENLCDSPTLTGYTVDGGYAEYAAARRDFVFPLPAELDDLHAAPLLCAGIIGFRSLRVAGVQHGDRVGLFGFGASAHLAIAVLHSWNCEVYVSTRGASHRKLAESLGAQWIGSENDRPPVELDRAVTFAPSGDVVIAALASLRKGGVVAINAIHLDRMPQFDYDKLLWGERQIRSVANMTRADARDFLQMAAEIRLQPKVTVFSLDKANQALAAVRNDAIDGAAVVVPKE
jgi:alcohol dehydrogenase, propanol-preferring